ncbi:MAG: hypothetical protein K2P65_02415 [Lachnospiraceae bacterium]|nr:hypothetical protein [Lachnospiraceae bacterium]
MKIIKRISLFMVMAGIMFGAGSYATLKAEQFFYPNKYRQAPMRIETEKSAEQTGNDEALDEAGEEQVIETAMEKAPVVTADTLYLIEEVNLSDGTVKEKEELIPVKYIGLDRLALIEELNAYDKNPALSDLKLGFQTIELSSFSKDRVVICKYYRPKEEQKGFYLMVADHYVIVYESDKKTVHMNTDILLSGLSHTLQSEIIQGKFIEDEKALYNFLESYSS